MRKVEVELPSEGPRPATVPLFRPEVLDARREQALGSLLLAQPLSARVLTLVAVGIAATLILGSFGAEFTRKARATGYLVPTQGLIKVYSRETGTIVERHVVEGQQVSKGDVLFVVSMERRSRDAVEAQAAAIAQLRERRASLRTGLAEQDRIADIEEQALRQQIDAKQAEGAKLAEELVTQERQIASATITLRMYQDLVAGGLGAREQMEDRQKALLEEQGKLEALQRDQITVNRDLDTLRSQLAGSGLRARTQRATIERDISSLDQQLTEYQSRLTFVVTAPSDGTATAVLADPGQTANPAQPMLSILPRGAALTAQLFVPSQSIGFVAVGQTVALRYQAFPYQRFGSYQGRVTEISRTLILQNETTLPFALPEPAYRVTVTLESQSVKAYGQNLPLQSGMLLDASIWLDRRKLYQWVLDPLYSVVGRM